MTNVFAFRVLVRNLPNWVPGMSFKRSALKWKGTLMELAEKPHAFVKQQMVKQLHSGLSVILTTLSHLLGSRHS